jgi:hypothetical protein
MYLHIPTCTYMYLHVPTYTYMYLHVLTYTYIYLHLPTCTYIHLHLPTCTYIHLHVPTCTYIYLHVPTYTYMYLHVPTYTYIYLHLPTVTSLHGVASQMTIVLSPSLCGRLPDTLWKVLSSCNFVYPCQYNFVPECTIALGKSVRFRWARIKLAKTTFNLIMLGAASLWDNQI